MTNQSTATTDSRAAHAPTDRSDSTALGRGLHALVRTGDGFAPVALRLALAVVMFPHGAQKMLGWFGGYGFSASMDFLTGQEGLPAIIAFLVIFAEFFGPIGLLVGLWSRLAAFGIGAVMVGAIVTVHGQFGFFMNWAGTQAGEGIEYHLLVLGIVAALIIQGSGALSLDRWLTRRAER